MARKIAVIILTALAMTFAALPAVAQEAPDDETTVEGVFALTLYGEVPEDFSFYVETDQAIGGLAPICTTDAVMVAEGSTECVGGGTVNELPFTVPQGATVQYRILGSQGTGLSQTLVAEGQTLPEADGFTIEASHAFDVETPEPAEEPGTAEDQYAAEASEEEAATPDTEASDATSEGGASDLAVAHGGVLPDTGGASLALVVGAGLVLAAGGFLAYRTIR